MIIERSLKDIFRCAGANVLSNSDVLLDLFSLRAVDFEIGRCQLRLEAASGLLALTGLMSASKA